MRTATLAAALLAVPLAASAASALRAVVALEPLASAEVHAPEQGARRIGYARAVAALNSAAGVNQALQWATVPEGGHLAALSITSPGAAALRAGLRVGELPTGAVLRFYAPGGKAVREVPAGVIEALVARNRREGETDANARTYWSPVVPGDTLVLEVELPPPADPGALRFAVPVVSHLAAAPAQLLAEPGGDGDAIAVSTRDGASFACRGTLAAPAQAPDPAGRVDYFLAAGRCIEAQSDASSLETFWASGAAQPTGSALLFTAPGAQVALVALDGAPPPGAPRHAWPGPAGAPLGGAAHGELEQWLAASGSSLYGAPPGAR